MQPANTKNQNTFLKENNYLILKNFVDKNLCNFLYDYVKLSNIRLNYINEKCGLGNYDETRYGTYRDEMALGDYSQYGDLIFDNLLLYIKNNLEIETGLKLTPTYSYNRLYTTNTELKKHTDRESCELSITLNLGYDVSNLKSNYIWPIYLKTVDKKEIPVILDAGDVLVYRGYKLEHWREPFEGINQAQLFLHYNEEDSLFSLEKDGRPEYGLPNSLKLKNNFDINPYFQLKEKIL